MSDDRPGPLGDAVDVLVLEAFAWGLRRCDAARRRIEDATGGAVIAAPRTA